MDREGMGGRRAVQNQIFVLPAADSFIKTTWSSLASFYLCYLSVGCIVKSALNCLKLWRVGWLLPRCSDTQFRRQAGLCPRSRR